MPADMNDYFKKRKPSNNSSGGNSGGGSNFQSPLGGNGGGKFVSSLIVLAVIAVAFMMFKPFTIINSGMVGIKVKTGKFDEKPLSPGLHFFIPVFEKILPVNVRVRMITYSNSEHNINSNYSKYEGGLKRNPAITVMDSRGLDVNIDLAVQYHLSAESAPTTIATWGNAWEDKIINTKVREIVRDVIGSYAAEQLPQKRQEIAKQVQQELRKRVNAVSGKPVELDSVELRQIVLPTKIKAKIEELQAEKQNVMIAEQQKERAKREAERKAEIARGEAEKNRIEAQGVADKIRIEADSQAKANELIAKSLDLNLLQLKQIQVQGKFNDALKVNTDAKIFLTPGGSVPNIWVDAKDKQKVTTTNGQ